MSKKIIIIIIAILAAAAGGYYLLSGKKETPVADIVTAPVKKGTLTLKVVATGVITPRVEVTVKSKAGGEILSFPFNEGDVLKKDTVAVRLDPETEEARTNQAEAGLLAAEARLEKAQITKKDAAKRLERQKKLFADGIISDQELDDAKVDFEQARADVKLFEAELIQATEMLKEARERLADTEIKAPFTGTILNKFVDAGQVISSTISSASEGTPIFTMANLDDLFVTTMVDEVDISRILPGQPAATMVDSLPGRTFTGVVDRISPKGKVERTVTVFDVVVEITDENKELLRPGMTADVEITTDQADGVLLVPNEALRTKNDSTGVYVMKGEQMTWIEVATGKTNGIVTEITGGLTGGEEVITSGLPENAVKVRRRMFF